MEVTREKAGAARNVERPRRRQRGDDPLELADVFVPPRPVEPVETPEPFVPLVVLSGPRVVVRLHGSLRRRLGGAVQRPLEPCSRGRLSSKGQQAANGPACTLLEYD